ncbi:MAG: YbaB/EbfC family nucleoid-associated protein [Candidatus Calescibacterium sp.]|nr:YbaB/EbfC family nucleoid-associated protein [Candidatus Calescibacterium sp.]MCX7972648.1 YbaB/EbfC family nucleoid-associated protein [bacterium]MDW8194755.1 YbaB/EbfC family nucleoid-associated protein [Candidatus Calescibacterium sp.]
MQLNKSILTQVQNMMAKMQQEMSKMSFEGTSGNGKVKVTCNGLQEITSVKLDPELLKEDVSLVEDLILVAVNDALNKSKEAGNNAVARLMANMNLPNIF